MRTVALSLILALTLAACGQKGALYLPDQPAPQKQGDEINPVKQR